MKATKRLFTGFLALVMMLCLSMTAFATGGEDYTDVSTVTIKKKYVATNADTTSPAETFTLVQVGSGKVTDGEATSAPALGTITGAEFKAGAAQTGDGVEGQITIKLPDYDRVGVYEYTLQEVAGTTAGVTYYGNTMRLVVTVMQGTEGKIRVAAVHTETEGTKSDTFTNTYEAGSLKVTKKVTGKLGDQQKEFNVKVTFTAPTGKTVKSTITYTDGDEDKEITPSMLEDGKETVEITLKHDETVTFNNIPYGVTYLVVEDDYTASENGGYDTAAYDYSDQNKEVNTALDTVTITNNKGVGPDGNTPDTGITLDSMPYILVLACVAAAGVGMIAKKRKFND